VTLGGRRRGKREGLQASVGVQVDVSEEEGSEEAAYHPGSKPAGQDRTRKKGLLYQPLNEAGGVETTTPRELCVSAAKGAFCARYVDAWGFIETFGKTAEAVGKKVWHAVKSVWHKMMHQAGTVVRSCVAGGSYKSTNRPI
jgi:hypothetical protein